ncbi:hypothetical protein DFJ43DRAFT_1081147 [Lentinula guzmanii]|uniref:Uncharacterized protein n=1 Tax=Lentinula guzmanii TaxID=2804957 RepID=A0AA38MYJ4_9AGAR|nr:hypothetical protein DFJ43DRAFT_1081147 [Lentinula guzmanii]
MLLIRVGIRASWTTTAPVLDQVRLLLPLIISIFVLKMHLNCGSAWMVVYAPMLIGMTQGGPRVCPGKPQIKSVLARRLQRVILLPCPLRTLCLLCYHIWNGLLEYQVLRVSRRRGCCLTVLARLS